MDLDQIGRSDLKVILIFALHIAKVDDDFADGEKQVLKRLFEVLHLSEDEKNALVKNKHSLNAELRTIESDFSKEMLVKVLCAVAHADHHEGSGEVDFIRKVNKSLNNQVNLLPIEDWEVYEYEVLSQLRI